MVDYEVMYSMEWLNQMQYDAVFFYQSKVSIYVSSPQGLVRYHKSFNIDYYFTLKSNLVVCLKLWELKYEDKNGD